MCPSVIVSLCPRDCSPCSAEEPAQGVPRQLTAVKSDLIAFSPKKPDESIDTPPEAAPAPALAADLSSSAPPPNDSNVAQLLKKQELYFQDQVRRNGGCQSDVSSQRAPQGVRTKTASRIRRFK